MITAELIRKITELDPNGSQQVILYDNTDDYIFGVASIEAWPQPAKGYPEAVAITLGDAATDIARVCARRLPSRRRKSAVTASFCRITC